MRLSDCARYYGNECFYCGVLDAVRDEFGLPLGEEIVHVKAKRRVDEILKEAGFVGS